MVGLLGMGAFIAHGQCEGLFTMPCRRRPVWVKHMIGRHGFIAWFVCIAAALLLAVSPRSNFPAPAVL